MKTQPGRHRATVAEACVGQHRNEKKTPYLWLSLVLANGERVEKLLYLTEKAMPYTVLTLRQAFMFDGNFGRLEQLIGKECSVVIEPKMSDSGREYAEVTRIYPASEKPGDRFIDSLTRRAMEILDKDQDNQDDIPF